MVFLQTSQKCGQEEEVVLSLLLGLSSQLVKHTVLLGRWGLAGP